MTYQEKFFKQLDLLLTIACWVSLGYCIGNLFTDPTDKGFFERSGMRHHVDAETGVHYLSRDGVLIPRLDKNGLIYKEKTK